VFSEQNTISIMILLLISVFSSAVVGQTETLERVRASYAALQAAESDFEQLRSRGGLSTSAAADYRAYIAQLRQQFHAACALLAQSPGSAANGETPCPGRLPTPASPPAIDLANEQTQGERTSALTRQLDAALGDFDEMLLREQEQVKAATPPVTTADIRASGTSGTRNGSGDSGSGETSSRSGDIPERGDAAGEDPGGAGSASGGTSASSTDRAAGSRQTPPGVTPPDIPDGSDDDVVARQLREAAEKETDPALRARLWEEYRKYKRGTR